MFRDIILYAYSGRQYWEMKGVSFSEIFQALEEKFNYYNEETVFVPELSDLYIACLRENKIIDNHLTLYTPYNGIARFNAGYNAYFSDIIVEQKNDSYIVVNSNTKIINIGDNISTDQEYLFRTLAPKGKKYFLIGIRSWTPVSTITVNCNGKEMPLALHRCRANAIEKGKAVQFLRKDKGQNVLIMSNSFSRADTYTIRQAYELGVSLRQQAGFIWDISNNGGGSSDYPENFIEGLNGYCNENLNVGILHSNYTDDEYDKKPYYNWEFKTGNNYEQTKAVYNGALYVIMNTNTASSGELAIAGAKSVRNCITFGENSHGCGVFGEVKKYKLPYSNIVMCVPSKLFIGDFEEGKGYEPDYWVVSSDVQSEVIKWIQQ